MLHQSANGKTTDKTGHRDVSFPYFTPSTSCLPPVPLRERIFLVKSSPKGISGTGINFPIAARGQLVKQQGKDNESGNEKEANLIKGEEYSMQQYQYFQSISQSTHRVHRQQYQHGTYV